MKVSRTIQYNINLHLTIKKQIDEEWKKQFKNTFKFSKNDINKFILFRKGVYCWNYMDEWEKLNETSWTEKEEFYSNLNLDNITDVDYMHAKRVVKILI